MGIRLGWVEPERAGEPRVSRAWESARHQHQRDGQDVKVVWKGKRISKLIFPSGKFVEFSEG